MQHVARMAGLALADLNRCETSSRSAFVVPYAKDVWQTARLQRLPNLRRAGDTFEQTRFIHRFVLRRAGKDRIVAVHNRLHIEIGTRYHVVRVVTHPFAERPFRPRLTRNSFTFENNFCIGRNRKSGKRSLDNIHRLTPDTAGEIIFRNSTGKRASRQQIEQRILATYDDELSALSPLEIFVTMNAPVFAFSDLATDGFFIVHLTSISTEVIPLRIRILGDAHIGSTNIAMRVALMMHGYGKLQHVDLVAFQNIIKDRSGLDVSGLDKLHVFHAVMVGFDDIRLPLILQG